MFPRIVISPNIGATVGCPGFLLDQSKRLLLCFVSFMFCFSCNVRITVLIQNVVQADYIAEMFTGLPRFLKSPEFFFLKIQGPGKSWKITLVLESLGKISLKITHFLLVQMEIIFFCSLCLQITPLLFNLWWRYVTFKHSCATKRS